MMPKGMHRFIEARLQEAQSRGELGKFLTARRVLEMVA